MAFAATFESGLAPLPGWLDRLLAMLPMAEEPPLPMRNGHAGIGDGPVVEDDDSALIGRALKSMGWRCIKYEGWRYWATKVYEPPGRT